MGQGHEALSIMLFMSYYMENSCHSLACIGSRGM